MIEIFIEPTFPSGEVNPTSPEDRVRSLAECLAGFLGPLAVRREGPSQPPYLADDMRYQLDQGNDWFLHAEEEPDGVIKAVVTHRYRTPQKIEALRGAIQAFTYYRLTRPS